LRQAGRICAINASSVSCDIGRYGAPFVHALSLALLRSFIPTKAVAAVSSPLP
jgi:hypothetical protein